MAASASAAAAWSPGRGDFVWAKPAIYRNHHDHRHLHHLVLVRGLRASGHDRVGACGPQPLVLSSTNKGSRKCFLPS